MSAVRGDAVDEGSAFRQLLIADLALIRNLVQPHEVASALMRAGEPGQRDSSTLVEHLRRLAGLTPEALEEVVREADRLIEAAGGDADAALTHQGGLDRSIHAAVGQQGGDMHQVLGRMGVGIRTSLRRLPGDRYVDFEIAGRGGMGIVYLALDTELNRKVAFKIVRPAPGTGEHGEDLTTPVRASPPEMNTPASLAFEQLKSRFLQEAWVTGGLEHPGIVPVYELGETVGGVPYYTMRFVRGRRTLADALQELSAGTFDQRLALLEPFLKLCDTVGYAHSQGVVHRDLKPDNVALGEFGEVVLLDWGLAKVQGREDTFANRLQERIEEFRRISDMQTLAGCALGTPGYMAPEAALGQVAEADGRSDVYSLGVILFQVLTGRLPFASSTFGEFVVQVTQADAPAAQQIAPDVPEALTDLCAQALAREKSERPESAQALAAALRAWQAASAVEREVQGLLRDADAALRSAEGVSAEARLVEVDRAAAALQQVAARKPDSLALARKQRRAVELREAGVRERERASGRRLLRRTGLATVALLAIGAVLAAVVFFRQRAAKGRALEQVRREEVEKTAALDTTSQALEEVLRLSDSKVVRDLIDEADRLWPLHPSRVPAMVAWIARVERVLGNRDQHERAEAALRQRALPYGIEERERDRAAYRSRRARRQSATVEAASALARLEGNEHPMAVASRDAWTVRKGELERELAELEATRDERVAWRFESPDDEWQLQVLGQLLADMERLRPATGGGGLLQVIRDRQSLVAALRRQSVEAHADRWAHAIASIADEERHPAYAGLRLTPQLDLVPLGADPDSGLFEFAHVGSGTIPQREVDTRKLVYPDDAAIVLVLLPGGTYWMGAQKTDPEGANHDPSAQPDESARSGSLVHVTLPPFFLAKHECTQAQWQALSHGGMPSEHSVGERIRAETITPRNPVEKVSWEECHRWLSRWNLALPTEAAWEYACRAGTDTPWCSGREVASLQGFGNVADAWCKAHGGHETWAYSMELDDGYVGHAPVGTYRPNAFGLHDMHGNVWEWCENVYGPYSGAGPTDPVFAGPPRRAIRGGSWQDPAVNARSADRARIASGNRVGILGVRAARSITPR